MKKIAISLMAVAVIALPSAAIASDTPAAGISVSQENPGVGVGGNYGTSGCYIAVDYFRADVAVQTTRPYVDLTTEGTIGGEVHCPVPPLPPINKD